VHVFATIHVDDIAVISTRVVALLWNLARAASSWISCAGWPDLQAAQDRQFKKARAIPSPPVEWPVLSFRRRC